MKLTIRFEGGSLDSKSASPGSPLYKSPPFNELPDFQELKGVALQEFYYANNDELYVVKKINYSGVNTDNPTGEIVFGLR